MRILTVCGAFLVSLGLLIGLFVVASGLWNLFTIHRLSAEKAGLLWGLAPLGLLVAGGALLALSYRARKRSSDSA